MKKLGITSLAVMLFFGTSAQDSWTDPVKDTTDMTFQGTKINPYHVEYDSSGNFTFSGYLDTYYAQYADSGSAMGFSKFPTEAPRSNQFGINMVQLSGRYMSTNFRGTVTLFGGDCPTASWSPYLNYIQEANAGFRVYKKVWLDMGFFRTHIGLESIQPRENMTMSLATTTYFEPYFLAGAKLTYQHSEALAMQFHVFNSFNTFVENNKNKAVGFSLAYTPNGHHSFTFSTITCDDSSDQDSLRQQRWYTNLCYTFRNSRWLVGLEVNGGQQTHSALRNNTNTAYLFSALAAAKYRFTHRWGGYLRAEDFSDPNEVLTGPVMNAYHQLVGVDVSGVTAGVEFKPIPNSYLRLEYRYLRAHQNETIFYFNDTYRNYRTEWIIGLGVWF